jgi:hypothetical protein
MSVASEKFCLKWNDFQQNIAGSYRDLWRDKDFSDVTLVCEENQKIETHQNILSACSPFFSTVLKMNKHSHPMIYMRGLKAKDLEAIVDFIYLGEANIYQEDLEAFLTLAEELQLKGLSGSQDDTLGLEENVKNSPFKNVTKKKENIPFKAKIFDEKPQEDHKVSNWQTDVVVPFDGKQMVTIDNNIDDLEAKINSLIEKAFDQDFRCTMCGKTSKKRSDMVRHVETHIEGVSYPCGQCGKVARSSNALRQHLHKCLFRRK